MINQIYKLAFLSFLIFGAVSSPLTAEKQETLPKSRLLNLAKLKNNPGASLPKAQKGSFNLDVRNDSRKVIVTHNRETAQVTFPYDAYAEIAGDFIENEELFFDYGNHYFQIDLSQKGKIDIKETLADINFELAAAQEVFGNDAVSWTSGKTKKYSYIDLVLSFPESADYDGDAIDFDLESGTDLPKDFSSYSDYYSDSSSFEGWEAKVRFIVSNKNVFSLATFNEEEGSNVHDKFIRSFELN